MTFFITIETFLPEIDDEGVVEPDTDDPQPMGDMNAEVCNHPLISLGAFTI